MIYVVFPVVVVIFLASRLSNSNFVVEIDSDELDEHSCDRFFVDNLVVVDVNVGLSDARASIIFMMMSTSSLRTLLPC